MKTRKVRIIVTMACLLFFAAQASIAVELVDSKNAPPGFVKVMEKDGKKMQVYGSTSTAFTPEQFHQIFKCYGLDIVDGEKAPKRYVKVLKDSEGKPVYNFGSDGYSYTPQEMNQLLESYGLMLSDPQNAPPGYVKVAKDESGETIFIYAKGDALAYPPDVLNNLLASYN